MNRDSEGRPIARKRYYLGGPLLVAIIYFYGNLYPWFRACLIRSVAAARDAQPDGSRRDGRLISLPWCLLLTLERLNSIAPSSSDGLVLPSDRLSPPSDESSNTAEQGR
jgi:hypothetical protein